MLDHQLHEREMLALEGDFSRLPQSFLWRESARLAHFLNGYEEAGGFNELSHLAHDLAGEALSSGR